MGWQFWKRNSTDPLADAFFNRYGFNLLSIPREKVSLCDVYMSDGNGKQKLLSSPGSIKYFLEPQFEFSEIPPQSFVTDEPMSDIYDTVSDAISANFVLDFVEGFLNTLAGGSFGTKIRGSYQKDGTHLIKLRFDSATMDRVDKYSLGDKLKGHKISEGNAAIIPGGRYYIVTAIARSPSINISAEAENQMKVNIQAQASLLASGSVSVSTARSQEAELKFTGSKKLAFGVELCELTYDIQNNQLRLDPTIEPYKVKGKNTSRTRKVIKPAFIGDPNEEDLFIDIV